MEINQIVSIVGMDTDPGGYAGRGATLSDLNPTILNKIAELIKKHFGEKAQESFVEMVWKMETLSATAFLTNLYSLRYKEWDLSKVTLTNSHSNVSNKDQAFALIALTIAKFNGDRNDTDAIRNGFVKFQKN